jgi:uncharacterized protein YutE (UPF0331/DUF86 family)
VGGVSAEKLQRDRILRHAVERILTQLVDLAVSVNGHVVVATAGRHPSDYRESFTMVAEAGVLEGELAETLRRSVGLRNVLTHEYVRVDLDVVAAAVSTARADYRRYVAAVADFVSRHG